VLKIGHVNAGEKLPDVEIAVANVPLPAPIVGINLNVEFDIACFDHTVDQWPAAVTLRASHGKFQRHL
jgi:hypothetical protein